MARVSDLPYPPHWINAYVFAKLSEYEDVGIDANQQVIPIFATSPLGLEELYKSLVDATNLSQPLMIQYDRMIRFRPSSFYPHKREQLLYYLYSTSLATVNNAGIVLSQLLDREDAAAEDLNIWAAKNSADYDFEHNVYFHNIKFFQTEEARDVMSPVSAKTFYVNKFIVEYDYHPILSSPLD